MKIIRFLVCISIIFSLTSNSHAQQKKNVTMVDSIMTTSGGGKVIIHQDESITNAIGKIKTTDSSSKNKKVNKKGYRIQAYSGSRQQVSKTEVYDRERKFRNRFPQYTTYVTFNSPFWKLRVGDFASQQDAEEALTNIKKAFPEYSNELYIVSENVRVTE